MKVGTVLAILLFATLFLIRQSGFETATVSEVQSLVSMAEKSPAARAFVGDALLKELTPTVNRVAELKREVNKILVREVASSAAGGHIGPAPVMNAPAAPAENLAAPANSGDEIVGRILSWVVAITMVSLLIKAVFVLARPRGPY